MLKQYFLDIMRKECNGLYLCEVPTGIGKSYQAAHAMEEYAKAMRQCARTITDERKLIYLTPLRKNVGEEEEELKKAYENEELFEKEVLHIKSNVDNIIENLGKVTIPQDKQPFNYDELKKQVKAYNGESSPEIKKIWEDKVEEEERKFRKEIKNKTIRSFLYYVPYVTLAVMTFPAILSATGSVWSAWAALIVATALAWFGKSLLQVSVCACMVVFLLELFL